MNTFKKSRINKTQNTLIHIFLFLALFNAYLHGQPASFKNKLTEAEQAVLELPDNNEKKEKVNALIDKYYVSDYTLTEELFKYYYRLNLKLGNRANAEAVLVDLASIQIEQGKLNEGKSVLNYFFRTKKAANDKTMLLAYLAKSHLYIQQDSLFEATQLFELVESKLEQTPYDDVASMLSIYRAFIQNDPLNCARKLRRVLEHGTVNQNDETEAVCYNIGQQYKKVPHYVDSAIFYLQTALARSKEKGNKKVQCYALTDLSEVAIFTGDTAHAFAYASAAYSLAKQQKNTPGYFTAATLLLQLHTENANKDSIIHYASEIIGQYNRLQQNKWYYPAYYQAKVARYMCKQESDSLVQFYTAEMKTRDFSCNSKIAFANFMVAQELSKLNRATEGIDLCLTLLKCKPSEISYALSHAIHSFLAAAYVKMNSANEAIIHHEKAAAIKDTMYTMQANRNWFDVLARFDNLEQKNKIQSLELERKKDDLRSQRIIFISIIALVSIALAALLILYRQRLRSKRKQEMLKTQKLVSQINPHFVSNLLVSIRTLMHKDAEKGSLLLANANRLMRDVFELSEKTLVSLTRELECTDNYLQLEQARIPFGYTVHIDEQIQPDLVQVPPLILQPIIENSIRHGFRDEQRQGYTIQIDIRKIGNSISYSVSDNGEGIGLRNGERRPVADVFDKKRFGALNITLERIGSFYSGKDVPFEFEGQLRGVKVIARLDYRPA